MSLFCFSKELLEGTLADKWIEEKDSADLEYEAFFRFVFMFSRTDLKNLFTQGG